jgi:hypothetical protein
VSPTSCDQEILVDTRGDGRPFDIISHELTSDCSTWTFTTRLAKRLDVSRLNVWELDFNIDGKPTGCRGVDRLMLAFEDNGRLQGYFVAVPRCESTSWSTLAVVPVRRPDDRTLKVTFDSTAIAHARRFSWWAAIDAVGDGGVDFAPNKGFVPAFVPPSAPTGLTPTVVGTKMQFSWTAPAGWRAPELSYEFTIQRVDDPDAPPTTRRTSKRVLQLGRLERGTYAVFVRAINGDKIGPPARTTITLPQVGTDPA